MSYLVSGPGGEWRFHSIQLFLWSLWVLFSSSTFAGAWANAAYDWLVANNGILESGEGHFIAQKTYHVLLFGVFGWLWAGHPQLAPFKWRGAIAASFLFGAVSEALQLLSPARHPHMGDALLNGFSGAAGAWLMFRRTMEDAAVPPHPAINGKSCAPAELDQGQ